MTDPLVSTAERDGWVVVSVAGEIDLSNVETLRRDLTRAIDGMPTAVDLSAVSYLDSHGLHLLHQMATKTSAGDPALVFVAREDSLAAELLRVTNMSDVVRVHSQWPTSAGLDAARPPTS